MPRAVLLTLMVAVILAPSLRAQRGGVGSGFAGPGFHSRSGLFLGRSHSRPFRNVGAEFAPYLYPLEYEDSYSQSETGEMTGAPPLVLRTRASEAPSAKPLVIEVPGAADSTTVKKQPPTIFVLENGERLEAQRFLLTATNLSFTVDKRVRTIPLDMLDISTTIAANRERGIDLRIPIDKNEISLSF